MIGSETNSWIAVRCRDDTIIDMLGHANNGILGLFRKLDILVFLKEGSCSDYDADPSSHLGLRAIIVDNYGRVEQ
jgi:hypothetical protein